MNRFVSFCVLLISLGMFYVVSQGASIGDQGRKVPLNVDDTNLINSLMEVERQIDNRMNSPYVHRVSKIEEAFKQIVSGVNYFVKFDLSLTECLKSDIKHKEDIELCKMTKQSHLCHAQIWVQEWLNKIQLVHIECQDV